MTTVLILSSTFIVQLCLSYRLEFLLKYHYSPDFVKSVNKKVTGQFEISRVDSASRR